MQQSPLSAETAQGTPSWYLMRGDKQYGPLNDRQLLLLAERGGLKTGDLLWKPGFPSWKKLRDVFDLGAIPAIVARQDASLADAPVAPTSAAGGRAPGATSAAPAQESKSNLKAKLLEEVRKFLMIFAYLWLVFLVFFVHEWVVLASNNISFRFYGLAALNALVLAKIMLVAESLRFAERFHDRPLIVPIVYKAVAFTVLLMAAYIVEEIIVGTFHGRSVAESFPQIGGGGPVGVLCVTALLSIAMVPFFAFREIGRVIGVAEFRALMLGSAKAAPDSAPMTVATEAA